MLFLQTRMIQLYSTKDNHQKEKLQELFRQNEITYKIKAKNSSQLNAADSARLGSLGNHSIQLTYIFYVKKEEADRALYLIKTANI